jgi:putative membrane protein insertion efficiency factor
MPRARLRTLLWGFVSVGRGSLILTVRLYQWLVSPLLGRRCRFEPTCSQYFIESVRKYGAIRGAWRGFRRVCRCHPWNPGGFDPP